MTRGRAPSALRRPISRTRSVTDTSMMFITPMPPTSSEIAAMPASNTVSVLSTDVAAAQQRLLVVIVKSALAAVVMLCMASSSVSASWYAADSVEDDDASM